MSSPLQPLPPTRLVCMEGRASQGIGPSGDPTGSSDDRGTATPDGNLTGHEPDSRPVRDHGMVDGTRQGPVQAQ